MKKSDLFFGFLAVPVDFLALAGAGMAAYLLRVSPIFAQRWPVLFYENLPLPYYGALTAAFSVFIVGIFAVAGLYGLGTRRGVWNELVGIGIAISSGMTMAIFVMFFVRGWFDSRFIILAAWLFAVLFVSIGRLSLRLIRWYTLRKFHIGAEKVLLVGSGEEYERIKQAIEKGTEGGLGFLGAYDKIDIPLFERMAQQIKIDRIILADVFVHRDEIMELANFSEEHGIQFSYVPDLFGALSVHMDMGAFVGVPLIEITRTPLVGWGQILKRVTDVAGALFGFVIFSPIFLIITFAIKWESKGPVIVRLRRVSQGRIFLLYKFRSMIENADRYKPYLEMLNERADGPLFKMKNDPRVTRVGKFLRRTRLDELPQLFNVLRGEISLVGPRPHEPEEVAKYERHHKKVFAVKAGVTGLAQISGASDLPFEEEVKLDMYYIENWSLKKDIIIIFKTAGALLFRWNGA